MGSYIKEKLNFLLVGSTFKCSCAFQELLETQTVANDGGVDGRVEDLIEDESVLAPQQRKDVPELVKRDPTRFQLAKEPILRLFGTLQILRRQELAKSDVNDKIGEDLISRVLQLLLQLLNIELIRSLEVLLKESVIVHQLLIVLHPHGLETRILKTISTLSLILFKDSIVVPPLSLVLVLGVPLRNRCLPEEVLLVNLAWTNLMIHRLCSRCLQRISFESYSICRKDCISVHFTLCFGFKFLELLLKLNFIRWGCDAYPLSPIEDALGTAKLCFHCRPLQSLELRRSLVLNISIGFFFLFFRGIFAAEKIRKPR